MLCWLGRGRIARRCCSGLVGCCTVFGKAFRVSAINIHSATHASPATIRNAASAMQAEVNFRFLGDERVYNLKRILNLMKNCNPMNNHLRRKFYSESFYGLLLS